jgi:hypothetical protein
MDGYLLSMQLARPSLEAFFIGQLAQLSNLPEKRIPGKEPELQSTNGQSAKG